MLTKEEVKKTVDKFPESFTLDELIDELIFIEKVNEGLRQSNEGKTDIENEAKEKLEKWFR